MQKTHINERYELLEPMGDGGMALVYLARDRVLNREVALKILREQFAEDEEFVERFRLEAQNAAGLSHPNVVQTYDRGRSDDGRYYIVMEYVPGGTLKEYAESRGRLEPGSAAEVAIQIASALGNAHEHGVIHRDVKPQNVLITENGDAKVADFGIARAVATDTVSRRSMILGTASYMSPEQTLGETATPRSDLYSLGVVLYEMLVGRVPFEADSPTAVSMKHVNEPPRPPRELNPEVSEGLNAIVLKLLSKDPEDRYADAGELVEDLQRIREGLPPLAASVAPGIGAGAGIVAEDETEAFVPAAQIAPVGPSRRKTPVILTALAASLILLLVFGLYVWRGSDAPGVAGSLEGVPDGANRVLDDARQMVATVSAPETVEVPGTVGQTESGARERLAAAGFEAEVRPRESSAERVGEVMEQSVPGGESVEEGSTILLAVGEGPRGNADRDAGTLEAPNLVGLTYQEAEDTVREAELVIGGVEEVANATVPAGQIVEQTPPAGTEVEKDAPIYLTTSTGPPEAQAQAPSGGAANGTADRNTPDTNTVGADRNAAPQSDYGEGSAAEGGAVSGDPLPGRSSGDDYYPQDGGSSGGESDGYRSAGEGQYE